VDRLGKKSGILCCLKENKWLILAFCIPVIAMIAAMAANGIYPFGVKVFVYSDAAHQYYPFLLEYREKLRTGQSLFYSWNIGMGSNFWALLAYYCASPLNILTLLVPESAMLPMYSFLVALKLGIAGLCCALFLKKVFGRNDAALALFGSMYGLCGFAAAFYWNIMWLDSFALMPLVMLGLWALVKEGKFRLYTISLFFVLWCNYLIGLYVCIFVLISFFTLSYCLKLSGRQLLNRLLRIAGASVLSIAMAAILLLPAWMCLTQTTRAATGGDEFWQIKESLLSIFANFGTAIIPSWDMGPANVYTSLPAVLLSTVYFFSRKIDRRQKLCAGVVLVFLMLCFYINGLEMIWNMMRKTIMLPARFSFLFSFILIVSAYQVLPQIMESRRKDVLLMVITAAALLAMIVLDKGVKVAAVNMLVLAAYGTLFLLLAKKRFLPRLLPLMLSLVLVAEMVLPLYRCMARIHMGDYREYPEGKEEIASLYEKIDAAEEGDFYRMTAVPNQFNNDAAFWHYRGVSVFSSTLDADLIRHMFLTGMAASNRGNRVFYPSLNSPLNSALLGLDYVIDRSEEKMANDGYLELFAQEADAIAYRNNAALSVGFMADQGMKEPTSEDLNAFVRHNHLFKAATGLDQPLYTSVQITDAAYENLTVEQYHEGHYGAVLKEGAEEGSLTYTFEMPRDGLLYGYVYCNYPAEDFEVDGRSYPIGYNSYIFCADRFEAGEQVVFSWKQKEKEEIVMVYAAVLEEETFAEGLRLLSDEQLQVTHFDETSLTGTIEVRQPGYFYTSIPYDEGWSMYVDGEPRKITPYQNAMIALEDLQPGSHTIELRFKPVGFALGAWISAGAFAVYLVLCLLQKKRK